MPANPIRRICRPTRTHALAGGATNSGNFINDRGFGAAGFAFSPSLQTASVEGTIVTRMDGR